MSDTPENWYVFRNAVYTRDYTTATKLLASFPELQHLTNSIGETTLHYLAVENDIVGVEWLHERGFDLNTKNEFGTPVLFEVAQLGYKQLFIWLVENGADTQSLDRDGQNIQTYLRDFKCDDMVVFIQPYVA